MNEKLAILTDKSKNIDYKSLLNFYDVNYVDEVEDAELYILDYGDSKRVIEVGKKIRQKYETAPILVVSDVNEDCSLNYFDNIKGLGYVEVLYYRNHTREKFTEAVQGLMYPQYPSKKADIAVVIPLYNEENRFINVKNFIAKLNKAIDESIINARIYFVNDGSKDDTLKLLGKEIKENLDKTTYIYDKEFLSSYDIVKNTKKAGTYIKAIENIDSDIMVFVDADDSFLVEDIISMINIIKEGYYEVVVGTKDLTAENRPLVRKFVSFFKRILTKPLLPKKIYDSQTGLKVMKTDVARKILPHLNEKHGLAIDLEIMYMIKKFEFRAIQKPVKCIDREGSHVDIVKDSIAYLKSIFEISYHHIIKKRN